LDGRIEQTMIHTDGSDSRERVRRRRLHRCGFWRPKLAAQKGRRFQVETRCGLVGITLVGPHRQRTIGWQGSVLFRWVKRGLGRAALLPRWLFRQPLVASGTQLAACYPQREAE
jgi:hypothetical protein